MKAWKIIVAVFSSIFGLIAVACLIGGIFLAVANATLRDADGFFSSPDYVMVTDGHALLSDRVDIASHTGDWFPEAFATVRFTVDADEPAFVGIGPSDDVDRYLGGVARAEVTNLGDDPTDVTLQRYDGGAPATPPGDQGFWVASDEGSDASIEWDVSRGEWTVVVMNADGSAGVALDLEAAAKVGALLAIAIGLIVFGVVIGVLAALALVWATRRSREEEAAAAPAPVSAFGAEATPYPLRVQGRLDPGLSRGLWLVKWLLAIPHFIVLAFLWPAFVVLSFVAFFAIVFTGRYPRGIFDFNVGVMRWTWRVTYYTYGVGGTDEYPPFALRDFDEYPARLDVVYPEQLSRGLVWVKSWLLAIPHLIIVGFLTSGLVWWTTDAFGGGGVLQVGGGLIGILVLVALLGLLFTGRYPNGLFDVVMGLNRWAWRVGAYVALMTDEYPPFRLDLGGDEPVDTSAQERLPLE